MAANSKRERLILAVVAALEGMAGIKGVVRRRPTLEQLAGIAQTELPKIAVTAGLPVPNPHWNERQRTRMRDQFLSDLNVEVVLYDLLYDDDQYDARVSSLVDDLWVILNADQGWNKLAVSTVVAPDMDVAVWDPYLAFKMKLTIQYIHGIGGI